MQAQPLQSETERMRCSCRQPCAKRPHNSRHFAAAAAMLGAWMSAEIDVTCFCCRQQDLSPRVCRQQKQVTSIFCWHSSSASCRHRFVDAVFVVITVVCRLLVERFGDHRWTTNRTCNIIYDLFYHITHIIWPNLNLKHKITCFCSCLYVYKPISHINLYSRK